jgi:pyocin large subunit-like protein
MYDDWYRRKNGDIVKYRYSTNEFGVVDKNGVIRTYFIQRQNYKYYERKKGERKWKIIN